MAFCPVAFCPGHFVLLGDVFGVIRSMERDLLSVLSIYPRTFLHVFIVHRLCRVSFCVLLYSTVVYVC